MEIFIVLFILLIPVVAAYLWWKLYNTADGERYLKMRMQGPFAPASGDEGKENEPPAVDVR